MGLSSIVLGNYANIGGKNVLFGAGNSGLNTDSLIQALLQAKLQPAFQLQQKITKNDTVANALGEFQQLLSTFKTAANALRNPPGVGNEADNAFAYNSVSLSADTGTASDYVAISASPGAVIQNLTITNISSIAAAGKQSSNSFAIADADTTGLVKTSGAGAGEFNAGTFTFNGADITLTTDDTLNEIAAKFNNVANQTLVNASVVKIDDTHFTLSFTGIKSGSDYAFDLGDPGTVTSDPSGVLSQITFTTNQDAADAVFKLDGQTITRTTNSISDVVDGITIGLKKKTPEDLPNDPPEVTITASIEADIDTAHNSVVAFFNAYNALREFYAKQNKLKDDGTYDASAVLATNSLFRNTMDTIVSHVTSVVLGIAGDDPDILAKIGITLVDSPATPTSDEIKNVISIDDTTFTAALQSNFNGVRNLFEFDFNTTSTHLAVFKRTNALATTEFTLDVNPYATQVLDPITVADANTIIAFDAPTDGQFGTGDVTVNGQTITITNTDTLNTIVTKFNAVENNSGLHADLTDNGDGTFTLTFTATRKDGQPNLFDLTSEDVDGDGVFSLLGDITATGTFQATYDDGSGPITIDLDGTKISGGYSLAGQDGTVLEGLELIYGSQAAEESDVTLSQGIADKMFNTLDGVLTNDDGALKLELESIKEQDDDLQTQIEKINDQVNSFREILLAKFAALEAAIAKVNTLLGFLSAAEQAQKLSNS